METYFTADVITGLLPPEAFCRMELQLEPLASSHPDIRRRLLPSWLGTVASWLAACWLRTSAFRPQIGPRRPVGHKRSRRARHGKKPERKHTTTSSGRYDVGLARFSLAVSVSLCLLGCRAVKKSEWVCDCASGAMQIAPSQGNPADLGNAEGCIVPVYKKRETSEFHRGSVVFFCNFVVK